MTTDVGSKLNAWGSQLEAQPIATSYIPTIGSIATRQADVVQLTVPNGTYDVLVEDTNGAEWRNSIVITNGTYGLLPRQGQLRVVQTRFWTTGILTSAQKKAIAPFAPTGGGAGLTPTIGSGTLLNGAASAIAPSPALNNDGLGNWKAVLNLAFGTQMNGSISDPTLTTMTNLVNNVHPYYTPFNTNHQTNGNSLFSFLYIPPESVTIGDNPYLLNPYVATSANLVLQPSALRQYVYNLGNSAPTSTGTGFVAGNESYGTVTPYVTFTNPITSGHDMFIETKMTLVPSAAHSADLRYYYFIFQLFDNYGTQVNICESTGYDNGGGATNFNAANGTSVVKSYWVDKGNGGFTQTHDGTVFTTPTGLDLKVPTTIGILLKANGTWSTYLGNNSAGVVNYQMNSGTYTAAALSQKTIYINVTTGWGSNGNNTPNTTNPADSSFFPWGSDINSIRVWQR